MCQGNALRSAARWVRQREQYALRSNMGIKLTCYTRREHRYLARESYRSGGILGLARMQLMPFPLGRRATRFFDNHIKRR